MDRPFHALASVLDSVAPLQGEAEPRRQEDTGGDGDHDQVRSGLSPGLRKEAGGDPSEHTQKAGWDLSLLRELPGWPESAPGNGKEGGWLCLLLPWPRKHAEACPGTPQEQTGGGELQPRTAVVPAACG